MLKLIDYYITINFILKVGTTLITFILIFLLVDIIDHLDHIMDSKMPTMEIIKYYYYSTPWYISIALPMSVLISTVFTLGTLQKNNELSAIKASGISIRRLSIPILILGILFSIFSFYFDNLFVTEKLHQRNKLGAKYDLIRSKSKKIKKQDIFRQESQNQVLGIRNFQFRNETAKNITIQQFKDGELIKRLDAPFMKWINKDEHWLISEYYTRVWKNDSLTFTRSMKDSIIYLNFNPTDLTQAVVNPEEMNYWELKQFVNKLKLNGIKDPRWAVNMYFKPAFACTSIIMILFGLSLSIRKPRSSLTVGVGISIFVIFLYYLCIKTGQSLGYKGELSPFLSVWIPNIIFLTIGTYLFTKTQT